MIEISVNWEDRALKGWLDPMVRKSTKYGYRTAFKAYAYFSGTTASTRAEGRKERENEKSLFNFSRPLRAAFLKNKVFPTCSQPPNQFWSSDY